MKKKNDLILKFTGFIFAAILLFLVTCYFGIGYLKYPLAGSDSPHAVSHIQYLYNFWPQKILWQPMYGRGMSLTGINNLGFWFTAMSARILGMTPIEATQLWQFLNMFLGSVGILLLAWVWFGYIAGLFAGFFFLISEISWFWQARIGLFEFQGAFIFFPLFFIFFHKFLQKLKNIEIRGRNLYFLLSIISLSLAIVWHLVVGILIVEAALFYSFFFLVRNSPNFLKRIKGFTEVVILGILLSSFFVIPFSFYNKLILSGKVGYFTTENLPLLPWKTFWGFGGWERGGPDIWQAYFAAPVLVLAFLGLLISTFKKRVIPLLISFIALFASLQASSIFSVFGKIFLNFFALVNVRAILISIIFIPIIAAYGLTQIPSLLLYKLKNKYFKAVFVLMLSLGLSGILIKYLDRIPKDYPSRCGSSYGSEGEQFCNKLSDVFNNLSYLVKPNGTFFEEPFLKEFSSYIPYGPNTGADISSNNGRYVEAWALASKVPILQSYDYVIPVFYQSYASEKLFRGKGEEHEINQIASWMGVDYLLFYTPADRNMDNYKDWQEISRLGDLLIMKSPNPTGLGTLSNRSAVLFVGDIKQEAYFKWWQLLTNGGINYSDAFVVDGGESIEKFSHEDLSKFKVIYLWGEKYRKEKDANDLIEQYLEEGGTLIIDTGWEYTSAFWSRDTLPDWMPVTKTSWHSFPTWKLESSSDLVIDTISWNAPKWDGKDWGSSVAENGSLRSGAYPLLTDISSNLLLAAGMKVGKGEVIWTGLNLVGMNQMRDTNAVELLNYLLTSSVGSNIENYLINVRRNGPEDISISFTKTTSATWLYWREAYYPTWRVKGNGGQINIYKGGTGLMLFYIPPGTSNIKIYHTYHWSIVAGFGISIITFIAIISNILFKNELISKKQPIKYNEI